MNFKRKHHVKKEKVKQEYISEEKLKRRAEYSKQKCEYFFNFEFNIPMGYCDVREYVFLKRAVRYLSPLTNPEKLAKYLKIDIEIVIEGIEDNIIPHFTDGDFYSIKTVEILPFARRFMLC